MLYISRRIGANKVGVVDTDDGVEQIISLYQFGSSMYKKLGVRGCTFTGGYQSGAIVLPYQPDETRSPVQLKARLLTGVDIKVYNDIVTNINLSTVLNPPVTIRLSDFGSKCSDCLLFGNGENIGRHIITLVFDDKISVGEDVFRHDIDVVSNGVQGIGAKFDLCEAEDVSKIYSGLIRFNGWQILSSVIDRKERFDSMVRMYM